MLRRVAFIVLIIAGALAGATALYWLVTELHSLAAYLACWIELIFGGICIAPTPDVL
jgi:hypothetical protein